MCLYLALMRRVLADKFTFAVLDDVVMSVDSQHRKQFCKLLKGSFPDTQFIITTHDQVWARQIRSEGLVGAKSAVAFHTWTVETGPVLDEVADMWDQNQQDLVKNEVPAAAGRLRRHLKYVASDLADELGAKVRFRADSGYDMGELLSAMISREGDFAQAGGAGGEVVGRRRGGEEGRRAPKRADRDSERKGRRGMGHQQGDSLQRVGGPSRTTKARCDRFQAAPSTVSLHETEV